MGATFQMSMFDVESDELKGKPQSTERVSAAGW